MSRWWGVALLSLSVGLNLGLAVAVLQQRLAPAPAVVVVPSPPAAAPAVGAGLEPTLPAPAATVEIGAVQPAPLPAGAAAGSPRSERQPPPPGDSAPGSTPLAPGVEQVFDRQGPPGGPGGPPGSEPGDLFGGAGPGSGPGPRGGGPSPQRLEEIAIRLGVPAQDRPRFIALQRQFITQTRQRHFELEAVRKALQTELVAPNPDREKLRALVEASARIHTGLEKALVEHVLAARQLLDGEPERRYLQFLAHLGPRLAGPPPPGGRGGGDPRWEGREGRPWGAGDGRMRRRDLPPGEPREAPEPAPTSPGAPPAPSAGPAPDARSLQASIPADGSPPR